MTAVHVGLPKQKLPMKKMIPDTDPRLVVLLHDESRRLTNELKTYHHADIEFTWRYDHQSRPTAVPYWAHDWHVLPLRLQLGKLRTRITRAVLSTHQRTYVPERWLASSTKWHLVIDRTDLATLCQKLSSAMFMPTTESTETYPLLWQPIIYRPSLIYHMT